MILPHMGCIMSHAASGECRSLSSKIIPAHFVRVHDSKNSKTGLTPPASTTPAGKAKEPKITLCREGDTVKAIEIECACGARIHLDCEY